MNPLFERHWKPAGPVAEAFVASRAFVNAIMGPVGSGKTSACCMGPLYRAQEARRSPVDGIRRYRLGVLRDTYRQLETTTIKTWQTWIPRGRGSWTDGPPAEHAFAFNDGRGRIEFEVRFMAMGEYKIEDVLGGTEFTEIWLNEADKMPATVLTFTRGRVGRYPPALHGGPAWFGLTLDFNAPDTDNYLFDLLLENRPDNHAFFRQPSGLAANAENLANLPRGYYQQQMEGAPDWYIRRMVKNEFGFSREGKPVFADFNDQLHVASEDLRPIKGLQLVVGIDAGRTPSAVICQPTPFGQFRVLDELVCTDMGAKRFGQTLAELLATRYPGFEFAVFSDPASHFKGDLDERTWSEIVGHELKVRVRAAPGGNGIELRLEAVRAKLQRNIDGAPGYLMSPRCRVLRKAKNSGYRFRRVQVAGERFEDKPEKNDWSHVSDAEQYAALGSGAHYELTGRQRARDRARHSRPATAEMD